MAAPLTPGFYWVSFRGEAPEVARLSEAGYWYKGSTEAVDRPTLVVSDKLSPPVFARARCAPALPDEGMNLAPALDEVTVHVLCNQLAIMRALSQLLPSLNPEQASLLHAVNQTGDLLRYVAVAAAHAERSSAEG